MGGEVGGAGAVDQLQLAQGAGDQAAIGQAADADRAIDAFLHQVDAAIASAQGQLQAGVLSQPLGQGGHDQAPGDAAGHIDVQATADIHLAMLEQLVEFRRVGQQAPGPFQQDGAVGGQLHLAGGAVQQPCAEAGLQLLHRRGHRGPGQLQDMGGLDETAHVGHLDEHPVLLKFIHRRNCPGSRACLGGMDRGAGPAGQCTPWTRGLLGGVAAVDQ